MAKFEAVWRSNMKVIYHFRSELLFNNQLFLSLNLAVVVAAGKSKENGTLKPRVVPRSTSGMSRENDMPKNEKIQGFNSIKKQGETVQITASKRQTKTQT